MGFLILFYPFLAFGCFLLICGRSGRKITGTQSQRFYRIFKTATLATIIFTPAGFGTTGFGFFVPWVVIFFAPKDTIIFWPLAIPLLIVGMFVTYICTNVEEKSVPKPGMEIQQSTRGAVGRFWERPYMKRFILILFFAIAFVAELLHGSNPVQ